MSDKEQFWVEVGKRVKKTRKSKRITQDELSDLVKLSTKMIYEIEAGGKGMSVHSLLRMSNALDVSTDYLLGRKPK